MVVTLPVTLLLLDLYPLKRLNHHYKKNLYILLEKIPFFVLSFIIGVVTIMSKQSWGAMRGFEKFPLDTRLLNSLRTLIFYLEKTIVPVKLVPFYPFPIHIHWLDLQHLLSIILVLSITGFCLWMLKQGKYLFFVT